MTLPLKTRYMEKVDVRGPNDCWPWKGGGTGGYGTIRYRGEMLYAHRVAWALANNKPIPEGLQIRHTCDHRWCQNPAHLLVGSNFDNVQDMVDRGRHPHGESHGMAFLTNKQIRAIRLWACLGFKQRDIAAAVGCARSNISLIVHRKRWGHVA